MLPPPIGDDFSIGDFTLFRKGSSSISSIGDSRLSISAVFPSSYVYVLGEAEIDKRPDSYETNNQENLYIKKPGDSPLFISNYESEDKLIGDSMKSSISKPLVIGLVSGFLALSFLILFINTLMKVLT